MTDSPWKRTDEQVIKAAMDEFLAECKGTTRIAFVDAAAFAVTLGRAERGDVEAGRIVKAVTGAINRLAGPKRDRPQCLFCEKVFSARRPPYGFIVTMPGREPTGTEIVIVSSVCDSCASNKTGREITEATAKNLFKDPMFVMTRTVE